MNKKIIYSLVGLALIFFVGSLIIFLKSSRDLKRREAGVVVQEELATKTKEKEFLDVKIFFLTEASRYMVPLSYNVEAPPLRHDLYKEYSRLLIAGSGKDNYIAPVPEGVRLRSVFFIEDRQMLVLDFNDQLINNIPGGTDAELEFIYYFTNNICYNFNEIKMVKFMVSGNEYDVLSGHIDIENPFYPDYRLLKDE